MLSYRSRCLQSPFIIAASLFMAGSLSAQVAVPQVGPQRPARQPVQRLAQAPVQGVPSTGQRVQVPATNRAQTAPANPAAQAPGQQVQPGQRPLGQSRLPQTRQGQQIPRSGLSNPQAKLPAAPAAVPAPFNLTPQEAARLDQLLTFWEARSKETKTYSCDFKRWDYDSVFGPKDANAAATISEGVLRYAAPDKGEFKVERIGKYKAGANGQPPQWPLKPANHEEHWICDGSTVYELNGKTKQLIEEKLPPGMNVVDGPIPFMFGAKKEKLNARYWMREIQPPKTRQGEYWIEALPKTRADAANFQKIMVILDEKAFLPIAMQIYPPGFQQKKNWTRQSYAFTNRKRNDPLQRTQNWTGGFIRPKTPPGWKKVARNIGPPAGQANPIRVANPQTPLITKPGQPIKPR